MQKSSQKKSTMGAKKQQHNTKSKKSPLKQQKRLKHNGRASRLFPKPNIPVKNYGEGDLLNIEPEIGPYYEDPQGHEPFQEEQRGAQNLSKIYNNQWRLIAGVKPKPFPAKIGITKQDTLYTYGRRVARLEYKHWINSLREMEEQRIERNYQIAFRQANEIRDRSRIYQAWRLRRKNNRMYDHTVRTQKHAAALAASYARGQENVRQQKLKHAKLQKQYIELMMHERRTTWIEDPDNLDPAMFTTIEHPTGWWPNDDTKQLHYNKFDTDDYDIEKYFTTSFPPYTRIRPRRDGTKEFYDVVQNGESGWRREEKGLMQKVEKYIDLSNNDELLQTRPRFEVDLPSEDAGTPELVPTLEARAGMRTRTFLLHEKMPHQFHGLLRNINSASNVEKPTYQPEYPGYDITGNAVLGDTTPKSLRDQNKPTEHRITL